MPDEAQPLDLAFLERRHAEAHWPSGSECEGCSQPWPCDALQLVAEVRRIQAEGCPYCTLVSELEAKVAALEAELAVLRRAPHQPGGA